MKILIVAKTRRGPGACVGGISEDGRSVRLIASDAACNERVGLEYEVGEVWEIDSAPDEGIIPPHVENIIVLRACRLRRSQKLVETIHRFMPPLVGGPDQLFDGLTQATGSGGLYIAQRSGLPHRSTLFWVPDRTLRLDCEGKRLRYRYSTNDGGRTLTFVGFQDPLPEIPAGTLLRVSLAHWWRPKERPEEELRCFVQLSGWFLESSADARQPLPRALLPGTASSSVHPDTRAPPASLRERALQVLDRTFGFKQFLPLQADVIVRTLQRQDALVVMPTGGGKSLCYELPALLFDGLTVVVSPLVALMQDQVGQLSRVGVSAACLNHMVPLHEHTAITHRVREGCLKLLYLAPEALLRPETLVLLEQSHLCCLAIDEAHCISEWGHDFRPEYRQLQDVRRRFPQAVCLALTATATPSVREDIRRLLGLGPKAEFVASFNRPNLFLAVEPRHDGLAQVLGFLEQRRGQSGIIYCGMRKQADELCASLNANGWPALPYHAGLEDAVRCRNQERFLRDEAPLMVATIAFGMGINKANVRFIIHAHLPKDVESYYQEIGRAGRDGLRADCLLLYSRGDAIVHRHFIHEGAECERHGREARLQALMRFAETRHCRRESLLAYFGETLEQPCGHCDNCVQSLPRCTTDVTAAAQQFLSCVKLTGQGFGPPHIIAVLRGSRAKRVVARRHDRLSVFGIGRAYSTEQWRALAQEFIRLGLLEQGLEFGGLRLAPKGWEVLNGKGRALVPREWAPAPALEAASSEGRASSADIRPANRSRFQEIGRLFAAGHSIEQIAHQYDTVPETVIRNLYRFQEAGGVLDPERLLGASRLPESARARVFDTFRRLGCERLAPVYEALSHEVSYQEFHLLRLYFLCRDGKS
jgi:ATP-dependent DNA helicase RecQ